jgi:hypothetical protein
VPRNVLSAYVKPFASTSKFADRIVVLARVFVASAATCTPGSLDGASHAGSCATAANETARWQERDHPHRARIAFLAEGRGTTSADTMDDRFSPRSRILLAARRSDRAIVSAV